MADTKALTDRITQSLAEATRDMTPLETFAQVGRAAAKAATSDVTFGDAMNAQKAERINAAKQMSDFLSQQRQLELQEQAGQQAAERLDIDRDRMGMEKERLGMDRDRLGLEQERVGIAKQESARADERLGLDRERVGLEESRLAFDRDQQLYDRLKDAADRQDENASAVVKALNDLVPEEQRATYAAKLEALPYDVDGSNVVATIGRIRRRMEAQGEVPKPEADYDDEAGLRKEFTKLSDDFLKVRDAYGRVLASTQEPSPAGDLSLIFNFMKMLDPGSTVREGEFANAANAAPLLERMGISFDKISTVWEGKTLTERQREDFVKQARGLFRTANTRQDALAEGWRGIAERRNFDPDNVVLDLAGPLRYRAMDDEELVQSLENATTKAEIDAILAESDRRGGGQ